MHITEDAENELERIDTIVEKEISVYENLEMAQKKCNLLEWWHLRRTIIPNLYTLAILVHSIPASSASVESSFSIAAQVVTPQRTRLKPERIECLLLAKNNTDLLKHNERPTGNQYIL